MADDVATCPIWQVLTESGTLFHYVGDPSSKASGRLFKGVIERLRDAGFEQVQTIQQAYGVVARCRSGRIRS